MVSMFFDYGMYARHLSKYFRHFGRERVLLLRSEDFYADAQPVVESVLKFARLQPLTGTRLAAGQGSARRNSGTEWGSNYSGKLLPPERGKLARYYRPHNHALYELAARDFGWDGDTVESTPVGSVPPPPRIEL